MLPARGIGTEVKKRLWPLPHCIKMPLEASTWLHRGHKAPSTGSSHALTRHDMSRAMKRALAHERVWHRGSLHIRLPPGTGSSLPRQRIPRTIVQVGGHLNRQ